MLKKNVLIVIVIFLLSFILRLWFVSVYSSPIMSDEREYDRLAVSILKGEGYVNKSGQATAIRPPGYPAFLAGMYFLAGKNYFFVRIVQAVAGSMVCVLIYWLGRRMFSLKTGILAGFLSAVHLGFIAQPEKILTEGLGMFFLLLTIIFFYQARKYYPRKKYYVLTGLFLGMTSLIRSNLVLLFCLLPLPLIFAFIRRKFSFRDTVQCLAVYACAFCIVVLPWTARNYKVFHQIVPLTTVQGIAFYTAYNPLGGKLYGFIPDDEITRKAQSLSSEAEQSRYLTKETFRLLKGNPALFFRLIGLKMAYLFSPFDWEIISGRVVYNYLYVFYLPFFIIAVFLWRRGFNELAVLYLPVAGIVLTAVIIFGIPRFRLPVEPYMLILASAAIVHFYEKVQWKWLFAVFVFLFLLANFSLYLNSEIVKALCQFSLKNIGVW